MPAWSAAWVACIERRKAAWYGLPFHPVLNPSAVILVDFIELKLRQGMPLAEAVVEAGAVRFRPMLLTAAAVVVGSLVILFDPIFQGLAISLMMGVAATFLSRMAVPVVYYLIARRGRADVLRQESLTSAVAS